MSARTAAPGARRTSRAAAPGARRASRVTALGLAALALLLLPGSLVLYALTGQNLAENGGQDVVVFASCVTVGLIIAWHRPGNPIGWLILAGVDVQGLAIDAFSRARLDATEAELREERDGVRTLLNLPAS